MYGHIWMCFYLYLFHLLLVIFSASEERKRNERGKLGKGEGLGWMSEKQLSSQME